MSFGRCYGFLEASDGPYYKAVAEILPKGLERVLDIEKTERH